MSATLYLFAFTVLLAGALAAISIRAPRSLPLKLSALALTALFLPITYLSLEELLGRPKPIALEWRQQPEFADAAVLASDIQEGHAIYLWLKPKDAAEPRYYRLPWSKEAAAQLHRAQRAAEESGTQVRVSRRLALDGDESEQIFYQEPQPALPPKQASGQSELPQTAGLSASRSEEASEEPYHILP